MVANHRAAMHSIPNQKSIRRVSLVRCLGVVATSFPEIVAAKVKQQCYLNVKARLSFR